MNPLLLLRMAQWARRRPSLRVLIAVLAVLAVAALLAGFEAVWGWPEALTPSGRGSRVGRLP